MSGSMFAFRPEAREFTPSGNGVSSAIAAKLFDDATTSTVKGVSLGVASALQPASGPTAVAVLQKGVYLGSELSAASTSASSNVSKSNWTKTKLNPDAPSFVPKLPLNCTTVGRSSTVTLPSAYVKPVRASEARGICTELASGSNVSYLDTSSGAEGPSFSLESRTAKPSSLEKHVAAPDLYDSASLMTGNFTNAERRPESFEAYSGTPHVVDVMISNNYHTPYHQDPRRTIDAQNVNFENSQQIAKQNSTSSINAAKCLENVSQAKTPYIQNAPSVPLFAANSGLNAIPAMYTNGLAYPMGTGPIVSGSSRVVNGGHNENAPVMISGTSDYPPNPEAVLQKEGTVPPAHDYHYKQQPQHQFLHNNSSSQGRQNNNRRSLNDYYTAPRKFTAIGKRNHDSSPVLDGQKGKSEITNRFNQQDSDPSQRPYVASENTQNGVVKGGTPRLSNNYHNLHYGEARPSMKNFQQNHPGKRVSGTYGNRRNMTSHLNNQRIPAINSTAPVSNTNQNRAYNRQRVDGAASISYQFPRRNNPAQSASHAVWQQHQQRVHSNYMDYHSTNKPQGTTTTNFMMHGETGDTTIQNEHRRSSEQRRMKDGNYRSYRNKSSQAVNDPQQVDNLSYQKVPASILQQKQHEQQKPVKQTVFLDNDLVLSNANPCSSSSATSAGTTAKVASATTSRPSYAMMVLKPKSTNLVATAKSTNNVSDNKFVVESPNAMNNQLEKTSLEATEAEMVDTKDEANLLSENKDVLAASKDSLLLDPCRDKAENSPISKQAVTTQRRQADLKTSTLDVPCAPPPVAALIPSSEISLDKKRSEFDVKVKAERHGTQENSSTGMTARRTWVEVTKNKPSVTAQETLKSHFTEFTVNRNQQSIAPQNESNTMRVSKNSTNSSVIVAGSPSTRRKIENAPIRNAASNQAPILTNLGYSTGNFDSETAQSLENSSSNPQLLVAVNNGNQRSTAKVTFGSFDETASLGGSHGVVLPQPPPQHSSTTAASMHNVSCPPMFVALTQVVSAQPTVTTPSMTSLNNIPLKGAVAAATSTSSLSISSAIKSTSSSSPSFGVQGNVFLPDATARMGSKSNSVVNYSSISPGSTTLLMGEQFEKDLALKMEALKMENSVPSIQSDIPANVSSTTPPEAMSITGVSSDNEVGGFPKVVSSLSTQLKTSAEAPTDAIPAEERMIVKETIVCSPSKNLKSTHATTSLSSQVNFDLMLKRQQKETVLNSEEKIPELESNNDENINAAATHENKNVAKTTAFMKNAYTVNEKILTTLEKEELHQTPSKKHLKQLINNDYALENTKQTEPSMFIDQYKSKVDMTGIPNVGDGLKQTQQTSSLGMNAAELSQEHLKLLEKKSIQDPMNQTTRGKVEERLKRTSRKQKPVLGQEEEKVVPAEFSDLPVIMDPKEDLIAKGVTTDDKTQQKRPVVLSVEKLKGSSSPRAASKENDEVACISNKANSSWSTELKKVPNDLEESAFDRKEFEAKPSGQLKTFEENVQVQNMFCYNKTAAPQPDFTSVKGSDTLNKSAIGAKELLGKPPTALEFKESQFGFTQLKSGGIINFRYPVRLLLKCRQHQIKAMTANKILNRVEEKKVLPAPIIVPEKKKSTIPKELMIRLSDDEKRNIGNNKYSVRFLVWCRQKQFLMTEGEKVVSESVVAKDQQRQYLLAQQKLLILQKEFNDQDGLLMETQQHKQQFNPSLPLAPFISSQLGSGGGLSAIQSGMNRNLRSKNTFNTATQPGIFPQYSMTGYPQTQQLSSYHNQSRSKPPLTSVSVSLDSTPTSFGVNRYQQMNLTLSHDANEGWRSALKEQSQQLDQQYEEPIPKPIEEEKVFSLNKHEENIQRKLRSLLNKLTVEKFDRLYQRLLAIGMRFEEDVRKLMELICSKAKTQHHFVPMYVELCSKLNKDFSQLRIVKGRASDYANEEEVNNAPLADNESNTNKEKETSLFRRLLVDACQSTFDDILKPTVVPETLVNEADQTEYIYAEKERKRGLVLFVAELCKKRMIASKIVKRCMTDLLERQTEASLELLHELMLTAGGHIWSYSKLKPMVDSDMKKIEALVEDKKNNLSVRIRCLLQEVIDSWKTEWTRTTLVQKSVPTALGAISKDHGNVLNVSFKDQQQPVTSNYTRQSQYPQDNMSGVGGKFLSGGGSYHNKPATYGAGNPHNPFERSHKMPSSHEEDFQQVPPKRGFRQVNRNTAIPGHAVQDVNEFQPFFPHRTSSSTNKGAEETQYKHYSNQLSVSQISIPFTNDKDSSTDHLPLGSFSLEDSVLQVVESPLQKPKFGGDRSTGAKKQTALQPGARRKESESFSPPPPPPEKLLSQKNSMPVFEFCLWGNNLSQISKTLESENSVLIGLKEVESLLEKNKNLSEENLSTLISHCLYLLIEAKTKNQQFVANWLLGWLQFKIITSSVFESGCKKFLEVNFASAKCDAPNIRSTLINLFVSTAKEYHLLPETFLTSFEKEIIRLDEVTN